MKTMLYLLISGILMSLGWSLRGQFGHLHGAMIPGVMAALIPLLLGRGPWLAATGAALAFSAIGFSWGGHLGYGKLVNHVEYHAIQESLPQLFEIFMIGSVWGGLGSTFLGYAISEKPFKRGDGLALGLVGIFWYVTLGLLNWESIDVALLFTGFLALHFYNSLFKKSKLIFRFGFGGFLGFGTAFVSAVLLLHLGRHNQLPGSEWWLLRDQIIGFLGGLTLGALTLWAKDQQIQPSFTSHYDPLQKTGLIFLAVIAPGVNTLDLFFRWAKHHALMPREWALAGFLFFLLLTLLFYFLRRKNISKHLERTLTWTTLGFIWFMSMAAILKHVALFGMEIWETGFTLFIVFSACLTPFLLKRLRRV